MCGSVHKACTYVLGVWEVGRECVERYMGRFVGSVYRRDVSSVWQGLGRWTGIYVFIRDSDKVC